MKNKNKIETFEDIILDILTNNPDSRLPFKVLQSVLKVSSKNDNKSLKKAINNLSDQKKIQKVKGGAIKLAKPNKSNHYPEGKIDINRFGTGYVIIEGRDEDIRIHSKHLGLALPDDRVKVEIFNRKGKGNRTEGKVVQVLERGRDFYVGTLVKQGKNNYLIEPDEKSAQTEFFVLPENIKEAKPDDKVIFKLVDWVHPKSLPEAEILEVIGKKGTNDAYILSILAENQIKMSFPDEVEQFASKIAVKIPESEYNRRKDIRNEVVFTIDPEDAKDFDDALSIQMLDNGNYYLGVHIADVSHYVQQETILDEEAYERGTSVYLVDRVIPMLPETLSNGVCSLRPKEDKLSFSCFMEIAPNGKLVDYSIDETVIHSNQRYSYEDVQAILDGKGSAYKHQLKILEKLAHTLLDKRFREGSINFETPEPRFILDDDGKPLDIELKERLFSHRIVEECMLMANKTVARHVDNLRKQSNKQRSKDLYPFFYRVHDKPDIEKLTNIRENVKPAGIDFTLDHKQITAKTINYVLDQVEDTPLELSINDLMLRAMAKAEYSPKNIGHFGLGFSHYAHFTSPIRRYPDVIVHRLLKSYASEMPSYQYKDLKQMGEHCSERERMAIDAERDTIKLKQVEYLSERIGEEFDGVVSGVMESGIFVDLKNIHCEGMVRVSDLKDDYYIYDQKQHCLVGRSKGKEFKIGTELRVKVVRTDLEQRNIDLILA